MSTIPYDRGRSVSREFQQEFRGINKKSRPNETELFESINLTAKEYPALTTRRERDYITDIGRCKSPSLCALGNNSVAYLSQDAEGYHISVDGKVVYTFENGESEDKPRTMIKMGSYLCVFPDSIVFNIVDGTAKNIETSVKNTSDHALIFSRSKLNGELVSVSEKEPTTASVGDVWYNSAEDKTYLCTAVSDSWKQEAAIIHANAIDLTFATSRPDYAVQVSSFSGGVADGESGALYTFNGGTYITAGITVPIVSELPSEAEDCDFVLVVDPINNKNYLYQYRVNRPTWTAFPTSYTRIEFEGEDISKYFSAGDVVEVGEFGYARVYTATPKTEDASGYIVVEHLDIHGRYLDTDKPIAVSRNLPAGLSNVIECSNRLWATDSEGKEIYASKLGDPFNWYAFSGLASDSYAITVGSGGEFTGAISYDGYPHFFKADSIMKVYGNYPFRLYTLDCPGVAKESSASLAVLRGTLIYKSSDGFYAYSGSYPTCISEPIEEMCGSEYRVTASAADSTAYYVAIGCEGFSILVYEKGVWHTHDAPKTTGGYDYTDCVLDLCNTGSGIMAAFAAEDSEIGFGVHPPTVYLTMLSGNKPEGMSSHGQLELKKHFRLKYAYLPDHSEYSYVFARDNDKNEFIALAIGEMFVVNERIYTVRQILEIDESTTAIEVGNITDDTLIVGEEYDIYVYRSAPLKWSFTTAKYGLSSPNNKYYSHLIFRYLSENPVDLEVVYDKGLSEKITLPSKDTLGSTPVRLAPRETEYITLSLSGVGRFELLSISKNIEGGNNP